MCSRAFACAWCFASLLGARFAVAGYPNPSLVTTIATPALGSAGTACAAPVSLASPEPYRHEWMDFRLTGVHPFIGSTFASGPAIMRGGQGSFNLRSRGSVISLRAGIFAGQNEIALEVSGGTYFPFSGMGPSMQALVSYAHLFTIRESEPVSVYWPLRLGAGSFGYNSLGLAFFQLRADLLGVAMRIGHVLVELHAPSLRYAVSFVSGEDLHLITLHFGGGVTYAF